SVAAVGSARLIQGLAMSSGAVIVRSIVRDLYAHEQAARLLATVTIVFSIVPIAAPLTGALLVGGGSWQAVFWFLAAAAALLLTWTGFGLAETAPAERRSIHPVDLARTFASILRERRFVAPFVLILCSHIGILSWVSNSSFTLVSGLGVTVGAYSLMFAAVMCGQISGAWSSRRLVPSLGIPRLLRCGVATMLAGGAIAALLAWSGVAHWGAVVAPFSVFLFGTALVVPNATALALSPFPATAGSASSLIGAIGFTAGAVVSSLLGAAFDGSARPMATVAAFAGTAAFTLEWLLLRGKACCSRSRRRGRRPRRCPCARPGRARGRNPRSRRRDRHAHQLAQLRSDPRRHLLPEGLAESAQLRRRQGAALRLLRGARRAAPAIRQADRGDRYGTGI